jgi:nucleotide-binding universal stress UspA family protein
VILALQDHVKRILVAIDDSVRAPHVLAAAMELARLAGAVVRVFRAIAVPPDFAPAAATSGDPLPTHLHVAAEGRIRTLLAAHPGVTADIVIGESHHPARAILDAAAVFDADTIVIGSHGYDLVDRFLGTTAAAIVNTSKRDVLVVHRRHAV